MTRMSHRDLTHKGKTDFRPSEREIQKAEAIIRRQHAKSWWPEDDWIQLSEEADLNLYTSTTERGDVKRATVYPVRNGETVTREWFRLYIQEALDNDPKSEATPSN